MPKESLWAFSEQMKEELAGQLSPILDETEAWLSIRAAIRGTAAEPHIRQERSLQVEELPCMLRIAHGGDWQKSPADMSHNPHTGEDSGIHTLVKIAHGRNGNAHLES